MQYIDLVLNVFNSVFSWFDELHLFYRLSLPLLSLFVLFTIVRFIVMPILGASAGSIGSDYVQKQKERIESKYSVDKVDKKSYLGTRYK